ncbi:MAG: SufD family Fe-S cluster assembly protein [Bacillota bacterium]
MEIIELTTEDREISLPQGADVLLIDRPASGMLPEERRFHLAEGASAQYLLIADEYADGGRDADEADGRLRRQWQLEKGSDLRAYYIFLGGGRSEWLLEHEVGESASIESRSLFIGKNEDGLEVKADYDFVGFKSYGRIAVDALLGDKSSMRYDASANVLPTAQLSDTRIDMRLRLDGKEAHGRITPALNIAANDVKAGHSASTYQLSQEDLFYLRTRGLEPQAIRRLLAVSLSRNFILGLADADTAAKVLELIESHL